MMSVFEIPALLIVAITLPVCIALLLASAFRRRVARIARFGTSEVVNRLLPAGALNSPRRRILMLSVAALLAGIAIAGPRWGRQETRVAGSGIDIVLALDASLSMLANDERPTRLERMKQEVRRLRASSSGDRIGVIAFAGRSYILTPLTNDEGALDLFLDNLDPSIVGQAGSAVSRAITQGMDLLLATPSSSDRALVIMSDWESFDAEEEVLAAAEKAGAAGIHVVAVGFGTSAGSRIPMESAGGNRTQFKLDEAGRMVLSRHNAELMNATVAAAGGLAVEAGQTDKAARVRRALSTLRSQRRSMTLGSDLVQRFQIFLVPALILLLLDTFLAEGLAGSIRNRRPLSPGRKRMAAASLAFVIVIPAQINPPVQDKAAAMIREKRYLEAAREYRRLMRAGDASEETLYNMGTSLLLADSTSGAARILDGLSRSEREELRYRALFNKGLAQLNAGLQLSGREREDAMKAAIESYRAALLMRPGDVDAKWNYELALEDQAGGGGGGQQQQQQSANESRQDEAQQRDANSNIGREQAEQILDNAARDERDVQARSQERNRPARPPGGKDW